MKSGITMLMYNKDDIEFVTEFPCFLGHPVSDVLTYCFLLCKYNTHFSCPLAPP